MSTVSITPGLQHGDGLGQVDDEAAAAGGLQHIADEAVEGLDLRAAEFVDAAGLGLPVHRAGHGLGHIADEDRLEARLGSGEGEDREHAGERRENG